MYVNMRQMWDKIVSHQISHQNPIIYNFLHIVIRYFALQ